MGGGAALEGVFRELSRLQARLDALGEGSSPPRPKAWGWGWRLASLFRRQPVPPLEEVWRLDAELDQVGIHTTADAQLLAELSVREGRVGELVAGLSARVAGGSSALGGAISALEAARAAGGGGGGQLLPLRRAALALGRAARIAQILEGKQAPVPFARLSASPPRERAEDPRSAIAALWMERARAEPLDLARKRRELDAAHELLLAAGAPGEAGVRLRAELARLRRQARRLGDPVAPAALLERLRRQSRAEPTAALGTAIALYEGAVQAGEDGLAEAAFGVVRALLPPPEVVRQRLEASQAEPGMAGMAAELALGLDERQLALLELSCGLEGWFEVEGPAPAEAGPSGPRPRPIRVPYPTQTLTFERTGRLHDLASFVITDPRTLVYDVASGRQLVRAYLEAPPAPRPKRRSAVRVYVCDASGSMAGARARFRDALLLAELNDLRQRLTRGLPADPLFFTFFNDRTSRLRRVETAAEAARQIALLLRGAPAEGQTDISMALISAFDAIRAARGRDPSLARATVVLVSDGEDRVDLELIRAARAPIGEVEIALSLISLGEENPDLRALAEEQRVLGARAFYHPLSDAQLALAPSALRSGFRTLLPDDLPAEAVDPRLLAPHLEALAQVAQGRRAPSRPPTLPQTFHALFPEVPVAPPGEEVAASDLERVGDLLEAIRQAAQLAEAASRFSEAVELLHHLLRLYEVPLGRYLAALAQGGEVMGERLARLRLSCGPL